ncbi:hypothetical protein Tsubulata_043007 [Turnera subulata]|uniref:NAC domain-containing protein n=1 Tax=Turnera subulata TaxID=218843 RepID=A0A9Q0JCG5_9ROSI|nr:hypothetical protein Tsubulata_043007 [Turnera subulata]
MALNLPTGYVFTPTDEELVVFYLKRKIEGEALPADIITTLDVYSLSPEELPPPGDRYLKDNERYFFTTERTGNVLPTKNGYYAINNSEPEPIFHKNQLVGFKKELPFYHGQSPNGTQSDWTVYEYSVAASHQNNQETSKKMPKLVACKFYRPKD